MILVTGGTGLVGSHLLYHLLLEYDNVKAIHQKSSDLEAVKKVFSYYDSNFEEIFKRILWVEADLNDVSELEKAFDSITKVYHCAAIISFDKKDYQKMRRINIEGTSNIVNLCISNSVSKLCYVSSIATLESIGILPINEEGQWNNTKNKSGYAITKYGSEMEVWRASQEGVEVVIVNPGIILGAGFWNKGSGKIFTRVFKGLHFYTEKVSGFVGVKDVVCIMIKLMQSDIYNERFVLVSENRSFKEVLFKIADVFKIKRPKIKLTNFLCEIVWRLNFIKDLFSSKSSGLNKKVAKTINSKQYYSSKKIKKILSYQFTPIDSIIESMCKDFLK